MVTNRSTDWAGRKNWGQVEKNATNITEYWYSVIDGRDETRMPPVCGSSSSRIRRSCDEVGAGILYWQRGVTFDIDSMVAKWETGMGGLWIIFSSPNDNKK